MNPILMTLANDNAKALAAMSLNARPFAFSLPTIDFGAILAVLASVKAGVTGARTQAA